MTQAQPSDETIAAVRAAEVAAGLDDGRVLVLAEPGAHRDAALRAVAARWRELTGSTAVVVDLDDAPASADEHHILAAARPAGPVLDIVALPGTLTVSLDPPSGPAYDDIVLALTALGGTGGLAEIAVVAEASEERVAAGLRRLERDGVVATDPVRLLRPEAGEDGVERLHPLERSALHRRAAAALATRGRGVDVIAVPLLRTEPFGEEWAIAVLHSHGAQELRRGRHEQGIDALRWCVAAGVGEPQRTEVLLELGQAELEAGDATGLERLQLLAGTTTSLPAVIDVAESLYAAGRFQEAAAAFELVLPPDRAADAELDVVAARALVGQVTSRLLLADPSPVALPTLMAQAERARDGRRVTAPDRLILAAAAGVLALGVDRDAAEALADLDRSLTPAAGPLPTRCLLEAVPATFALCGDLERAGEVLDAEIDAAVAATAVARYTSVRAVRAFWLLLSGRCAEAEADAEDVVRLTGANPVASRPALAPARYVLVSARLLRGDVDGAQQAVAEAAPDDTLMGGWEHCAIGTVALATGDAVGALDHFERAGRIFRRIGEHALLGGWRVGAAQARLALGDTDAAAALLTAELHAARSVGLPAAEATARRVAARLEARPEDRLTGLAAAVASAEQAGLSVELAAGRVEYGAALRRCGRSREARTVLRSGLELARRCGAPALAGSAEEELVAAGGRRVERPLAGVAALTPAEQRVVVLAAEGVTNRAVAEQLFLSVKTVETHLSSAYRKLGVSERQALAAVLDRPG